MFVNLKNYSNMIKIPTIVVSFPIIATIVPDKRVCSG